MENKVFENAINDLELKEYFGDAAIALLNNQNLIKLPEDLNHMVVEFGYLFKTEDPTKPCTMFKVVPPKKLFQKERVFYFGSQEGKLHLLNEKFNEDRFREVQKEMFKLHNVDLKDINTNSYKMELY